MAMTPTLWTRWTRKQLTLILVIVIFICAVIFLSVGLARPKPIPGASSGDASSGVEWQCSKALLLTTCTKTVRNAAVLHAHKDAICLRRA
jgi:hypothetical protein